MVEIVLPMGPTSRPRGMRGGTVWRQGPGQGRLLMRTMLVLIGLAPLPLGSNRPFFWGLSALVIGVTLLVWARANQRNRVRPSPGLAALRLQGWLFGLFVMFLVLQMLPIGPWLGGLAGAGLEGMGVVPQTISLAPGNTLLMLLRQLTYAAFFFLMLQVASRDNQRSKSMDVLLAVITGYAVVGLASLQMGDTILGLQKWAYQGSATGTFVNRNSYATFLAFGAVLAMTQLVDRLGLWADREEGGLRQSLPEVVLYSSALLLILAAVVSSQSRMGFVVTLCGMLTVVVLAVLRNRRLLQGALIIVGLGFVVVLCLLLAYGEGLLGRIDVLEKSSSVRLALYGQVLELIALRPWAGFGGGAFELAFPLVHQLPVSGDAV